MFTATDLNVDAANITFILTRCALLLQHDVLERDVPVDDPVLVQEVEDHVRCVVIYCC